MSAPTCRRCGAVLVSSYRTHLVDAAERFVQAIPDGSGTSTILAATSACSWNCLAVLAAVQAGPDADAAVLIVAERERQQTAEGYTPEADTDYPDGTLAQAGVVYAQPHLPDGAPDGTAWLWPWDRATWKPKDRERDLVRAGALIAAEADRDVRARRAREPF